MMTREQKLEQLASLFLTDLETGDEMDFASELVNEADGSFWFVMSKPGCNSYTKFVCRAEEI